MLLRLLIYLFSKFVIFSLFSRWMTIFIIYESLLILSQFFFFFFWKFTSARSYLCFLVYQNYYGSNDSSITVIVILTSTAIGRSIVNWFKTLLATDHFIVMTSPFYGICWPLELCYQHSWISFHSHSRIKYEWKQNHIFWTHLSNSINRLFFFQIQNFMCYQTSLCASFIHFFAFFAIFFHSAIICHLLIAFLLVFGSFFCVFCSIMPKLILFIGVSIHLMTKCLNPAKIKSTQLARFLPILAYTKYFELMAFSKHFQNCFYS